jgi:hypothetical protein
MAKQQAPDPAPAEGINIGNDGRSFSWSTAPDRAWSLWGSHPVLGRTLHVYVLAGSQRLAREAAHAWAEEHGYEAVIWPTWDAKQVSKLPTEHGLPVLVAWPSR